MDVTMIKRNPRRGLMLLAAFAILVAGLVQQLQGQGVPPAGIACYFVGRAYLNAVGQGEVVGYFTDIRGISGSVFNGAPGESTAFLTFRSDVFSLTPLPSNGDVGLDLVSPGTFSIYFDPSPKGDWSNPDTFSSGQLVARFTRTETLFLQIGPVSQHVLTESLALARNFTVNGHEYNFIDLVSGGITLSEFFSNTGVPGVANFPVGLAFAGSGTAVAHRSRD
jgi:hypothetical protein